MNIAVLDVETTGKDRATDQIIELCIQSGLGSPTLTETWRIKPSIPIHPEATAVHGIKDEDLVDGKPFRYYAPTITAQLAAADVIVGYGVAFDLDMLQAELARAGFAPLDLTGKHRRIGGVEGRRGEIRFSRTALLRWLEGER